MKLNDLDMAHYPVARMPVVHRPARGGHGALATFYGTLMKAWVGLYAAPPRRLPPLV